MRDDIKQKLEEVKSGTLLKAVGDERPIDVKSVLPVPIATDTRRERQTRPAAMDRKRREKVEALVEETVRAGGIAYVDRTDLDPKQRSHWVKIAKRCNVEVVALRFTATASTCIERAKARAEKGEHDGELNNPDKVAGLIGIMKNRKKQCIISRPARHRRDA